MPPRTGEEKRRAARVKFRVSDNLEVRYKFLSHLENFQCETVFAGVVLNLSKGGCLFVGPIPEPSWLPQLGQGLVLIGMNIMIPESRPVKALASLRWTRPGPTIMAQRFGSPAYELGVQFEQVDAAHRNKLEKFLIGHQLRTRRFRLRDELEERGYGGGQP